MSKRIKLNDNQIAFLKREYVRLDLTLAEIGEHLDISVESVRRQAKKLNLVRPKYKIYGERLEWLKENYKLPYAELEAYLEVNEETIRETLNRLKLKRNSKYAQGKLQNAPKEFWEDINNPTLTAPEIQYRHRETFDISIARIHQLRREGNIKLKIDCRKSMSSLEITIKDLLQEHDILFQQEYWVSRYCVDFYLGFKCCIEVNGKYWHSKRQETDDNKRKFLESKGYKVLTIWEDEIDNNTIKTIKEFYKFCVTSHCEM